MSGAIPDWLQQRARSHGGAAALQWGERLHSFAELAERATTFDAGLRAAGAHSGDAVGVLVNNRPELIALVHAVPRHGRTLVPLGTRLSAAELRAQIAASGCRALIYESATRATAAELRAGVEWALSLDPDALPGDGRLCDRGAAAVPPPSIDLDGLHSIVFTSGSSGRAKGVLLTWGNHFWNAAGSAFHLGVNDRDRWLACLPMNHVGGLSIALRGAIYGMPILLQPRFDPELANRAIDRDGVTIVSVVANMLARLLEARHHKPFPPTLRCVLLGGGPAPRALVERCRELGVPLAPTYGMTETASQIATAVPGSFAGVDGAVGRPLLGVELRITGNDGESFPAGEIGSIQVRGPIVSPGYLDAPRRADGAWFDTGDLGSVDDGGLRVLGRADDTIISGGENIHPSEVERALESHPAVAEACAFGVADERWGESVAACVRLHTGAIAAEVELREHCTSHLARFKLPRHIRVVDDFPRTPAGKIARRTTARDFAV